MIRQARRKEIRDLDKSIKKAVKTKEYKRTAEYFQALTAPDVKLLMEGTHPDPKRQAEFTRYKQNMEELVRWETRRNLLLGGNPHEDDV